MANRVFLYAFDEWPVTQDDLYPDTALAEGCNILPLLWLAGFAITDWELLESADGETEPIIGFACPADRIVGFWSDAAAPLIGALVRDHGPGVRVPLERFVAMVREHAGRHLFIDATEYTWFDGVQAFHKEMSALLPRLAAGQLAPSAPPPRAGFPVMPMRVDTDFLFGHGRMGSAPWEEERAG